MLSRKEMKAQVKQEFIQERAQKKETKENLIKLPKEQQVSEKKMMKLEAKASKKARKFALKQMPKPERKLEKRHDKLLRKLRTRPRRYTIWALVLVLVVYLGVTFGPVLGDIKSLMSLKLTTETQAAQEARENGEKVAELISDEGIVLLKNENEALPLKDKKVNVFGFSAINFRSGGSGSGAADQSRTVSFYQGLDNAGIEYNQDLYDFYMNQDDAILKEKSTGLGQIIDMFMGKEMVNEPDAGYLTDAVLADAKAYSENAIIVISSSSVEASDATPEKLKLSEGQKSLLEKVAQNFENVIVIINAGNTMELGFLNEYDPIQSALWVGTPGSKGANSIGKVLSGDVNPSGRLVDTYVYDVKSSPATVNFGDYDYTNIDGMSFINYNEGIYIGYRFYETYYKDDEEGYKKTVQFPFGYGLSYTNFEWQVGELVSTETELSVDVTVTNNGNYAGKEVVQLYFSAPYTEGGIEKSAIELGAYGKTSLLEPGASETITLVMPIKDLSSYDMHTEEAYVLEKGDYQIYVSKNVHEPVKELHFQVAETVVYASDEVTGTLYENQFEYADGGLTYLSRSDFEGTYPTLEGMSYTASQEVVDGFKYRPEPAEGKAAITGADNGILLSDLKGLSKDDPKWDAYLDQFTIEEMKTLVTNGAYKTVGVERLGLPSTVLLDGPAGINFFFMKTSAASYPTEIVISSTWNDALAYKMGEAIGTEANAYGVTGWYAPGMNIHRSALGGRNFEYYSEDPLLSGKMSAGMVSGAQSKDILVFMKHFALNEQEINARSGVMVWANEQAIREIYLRPFEITVKEAQVTGAMSSFIHIGYKWSGGNPELLQNVLREEWGFEGIVSTDALLGDFMDLNLALRYGNELMLAVVPTFTERYFDELYKEDPVAVTNSVRERTRTICYTLLNFTNAVK